MADALGKPLMVEETSEDTSRGVTLMVVKSLLKKNMLVKEKLDMNIQIWTSTKSEAYGHELKKQEELYRRLYKEERSAESWLVGTHTCMWWVHPLCVVWCGVRVRPVLLEEKILREKVCIIQIFIKILEFRFLYAYFSYSISSNQFTSTLYATPGSSSQDVTRIREN